MKKKTRKTVSQKLAEACEKKFGTARLGLGDTVENLLIGPHTRAAARRLTNIIAGDLEHRIILTLNLRAHMLDELVQDTHRMCTRIHSFEKKLVVERDAIKDMVAKLASGRSDEIKPGDTP